MNGTREKRCEWCALPRGECLCDSPRFKWMDQCDDCGTWRDVDHVHVAPDRDGETIVCTGRCLP
ncbi:hypothetical protein [Natrinema gari]|uniref:hypothetical protein n=1 Tax=Natrinema gari TaxID=419186 RepID=UPI000B0EE534|nr:hypothetical protein [Natrinema gari]